jgi:AraC family transcriptional regulator of adaptative response/methylated-DNA-[protein]-cysteine methyltransferase
MEDYLKIEKAIGFLEGNYKRQPNLQEIADHISLSKFHMQRLFIRWAGISPKRFIQYLTINYAKSVLEDSSTLLETAYESGLSGSGRLHDLFITFEAVTPGEYKKKAAPAVVRVSLYSLSFYLLYKRPI